MSSAVCLTHGLVVRFFKRFNSEKGRDQGGFYGCPKYGECGSYYCTKTGTMKTSKKVKGE